jgi:hypothetical protein
MSEIGPADMSVSSGFGITPRSVADLLFTERPRNRGARADRRSSAYRLTAAIGQFGHHPAMVEFLPARGQAALPGYALDSSAVSRRKEP